MNAAVQLSPSSIAEFMQQGVVRVGEIDIHFEVGGDTSHPVVLLVMGFGAQLLYWPDYFCKALIDQGFRVIRFDNRDIGLSSKIRKPIPQFPKFLTLAKFGLGIPVSGALYTLYDMAEDTIGLLDALKIEKAHIVGASMGGMIAQIVAAKHPSRLLSLGLLFSSNNKPLGQPPFPKQLLTLISTPKRRDQEGIVQHSMKVIKTIGSPGYFNSAEARDFATRLYERSYRPDGMVRQFQAILCTGSLVNIDRMIEAPTLIIHGSKDRLLPPSNGRSITKYIKGSRFVAVKGMAHDIVPHFSPKIVQLLSEHFKQY